MGEVCFCSLVLLLLLVALRGLAADASAIAGDGNVDGAVIELELRACRRLPWPAD